MKFLYILLVAMLSTTLVLGPTACNNPTQAQITAVVQNIANWTPALTNDAAVLGGDIAAFDPADSVLIQKSVAQLQSDSSFLTTLCNQYLANPSPTVLAQIAATVSDAVTIDSSALIAALQIKDATSQLIAQGVLATIATALTILSTYLASVKVSVTPAAQTALKNIAPYVNKATLSSELDKAKAQNLIPANITLQAFGY
jgi:hypothetical protein